jgi:hypothetical protein
MRLTINSHYILFKVMRISIALVLDGWIKRERDKIYALGPQIGPYVQLKDQRRDK